MKNRINVLTFFSLALIISCIGTSNSEDQKNSTQLAKVVDESSQEGIVENNVARAEKEDFETFYGRFNRDLKFQNERINYPLKGEFFDGTKDPFDDVAYTWTLKDNIDFELIELKDNMVRERESDTNSVKERIFVKNSGFQIELHFVIQSEKWYLVYYSYVDA